jgi:hypothetical protein
MTFRFGPVLSTLLAAAALLGGVYYFLKNVSDNTPKSSASPVAQAYADQAAQDFRSTATAAQAYLVDTGSYDGMTTAGLRAQYDAALPSEVVVASAAGSSYCLQATLGPETYSQRGPAAPVTPGPC